MARKTQLDKAIEKLDGEIAVLQAAKVRLQAQQIEQQAARATKT